MWGPLVWGLSFACSLPLKHRAGCRAPGPGGAHKGCGFPAACCSPRTSDKAKRSNVQREWPSTKPLYLCHSFSSSTVGIILLSTNWLSSFVGEKRIPPSLLVFVLSFLCCHPGQSGRIRSLLSSEAGGVEPVPWGLHSSMRLQSRSSKCVWRPAGKRLCWCPRGTLGFPAPCGLCSRLHTSLLLSPAPTCTAEVALPKSLALRVS